MPGVLGSPTDPEFERALNFGPFTLDPARKRLMQGGDVVRLGSRALDLLVALVERAGDVVSHADLFAQVWPRTVVEESSLRVHMSALRKALGDGVDGRRYIASLPGRGYSFVMNVTQTQTSCVPPGAMTVAPMSPRLLPTRLTGIVGRDQELDVLSAKLERSRLVTIVSPGGMGKTTVALALAAAAVHRHADGACFVDLAPLDDASLVPHALAAAAGVAAPESDPLPLLDEALAARDLLIVLDNCEHLAAAAAALAERLLRVAPRVRILATSREPLEAETETIYRLDPLAVPPLETASSVEDALAFASLRLFVERAAASDNDFLLSPTNLAASIRICRHLDGMPLAIELAASRVGNLGIQALADRLDDVFRLLRRGRRTALPRHQTLQALLDWSHDLMEADTRAVLHRLSVFRSSFDLQAAAEVAGCERIPRRRVITCVLDLVSRSLVVLEPGGAARYRLLFVARLYAAERLAEDGDVQAVARRHALSMRDLLARANAELRNPDTPLALWRSVHAAAMPDVRAALDWTHGPGADPVLGAELVIESGRLQLEIGLNDEFLPRALAGLAALRSHADPNASLGLQLLTLLCMVSGQCLLDHIIPADTPAQLEDLAYRIGSPEQQRMALFALCVNAFGKGDYPTVVSRAARYAALPVDPLDPTHAAATMAGWRFEALGRHYLGQYEAAWKSCERVLEHAGPWRAGSYTQLPLPVSMGTLQARIRWMQGFADEALDRALELLRFCEAAHPFALSHTLSLALMPILLWRGDDAQALSFLVRLVDHELTHAQSFWMAWPHTYCKVLALRGHDVDALRARLGNTDRGNDMQTDMLSTLAPQFVGPAVLERVGSGTVGWCAPEVLRVVGERANDELQLLRAVALARSQGARAWELRAVTSLAAQWQDAGRRDPARALLQEALAGITEGGGTADLRRAAALLSACDTVN
ncbi:ATP-binding protein [Roseateles cellulosilyticus]|uniref:Helix-turn-helix transcriptional regulator n=1 Tax=Pelomonas cellulosilytica TaxID=2906762 RepID=A0ABS8XV53_9BURK|nr:winged helix-turn-helix domain-containing protein [Pelomonas sp. P8]MCE4556569.1 helix-turn-helix transcriptional regulator [Pelomonas sp. P8]